MRDGFFIGVVPERPLCSAVSILDYDFGKHHISENREAYWITLYDPEFRVTVFKDTEHGEQIKLMLNEKVPAHDMYLYVFGAILPQMSAEFLDRKIRYAVEDARQKGYDSAKAELRSWLGVD